MDAVCPPIYKPKPEEGRLPTNDSPIPKLKLLLVEPLLLKFGLDKV
jgi:hypothetical protein